MILRHLDKARACDAVLPEPVEEVQARREHICLGAGLTAQGDDLAGRQVAHAEAFHDDADLALADEFHAEEQPGYEEDERGFEPPARPEDGENFCDVVHDCRGLNFDLRMECRIRTRRQLRQEGADSGARGTMPEAEGIPRSRPAAVARARSAPHGCSSGSGGR